MILYMKVVFPARLYAFTNSGYKNTRTRHSFSYEVIIWSIRRNIVHGGLMMYLNSLRPRQNGRHFADDIFNCISLIENVWISIQISLKFIPKGPINNIPALVQIMAWRRPGDKPLSEPMMDSLSTHICVTRPQWVKQNLSIESDI